MTNGRLLSRPVLARGVDVEGLARRVLADELDERGAWLAPQLDEDAMAFLIETIWLLAQRYDPARTSIAFSSYAYRIGRMRVTDFYRSTFGDSRYRQVMPTFTSLNGDERRDGPPVGFDEAVVAVDVRRLSPRGRRTLVRIARPIAEDGATARDLAARFGVPAQLVHKRLRELRDELHDLGHGPAD